LAHVTPLGERHVRELVREFSKRSATGVMASIIPNG
jgi:hypothetical protein